MSAPGRKSLIAQDRVNSKYATEERYDSPKRLHCTVLEVLGSHNPYSYAFPDIFVEYGIEFVVYCFTNERMYRLKYNSSYEELRTLYGCDRNIIGKDLVVFSSSFSARDVYFSRFVFEKFVKDKIQDEETMLHVSLSMLGGFTNGFEGLEHTSKKNKYEGFGVSRRILSEDEGNY